ncbi:hypothetical protein G9A89_006769 [Geosiphon pyriformis]|nr:hypothetical protein G9A89_006769 [Geosiphon pyriformis]
MSKKSEIHYYLDGDIILNIDDTHFRVHKSILSMASLVFKDMFMNEAVQETTEVETVITLSGDSASHFCTLLCYIYPQHYIQFNFEDAVDVIKLADKYLMDPVLKYCQSVIMNLYSEHPLKALIVADKFKYPDLYMEASKLVLEEFYHYKTQKEFTQLSIETKYKLLNCHVNFKIAVTNLLKLYKHLNIAKLNLLTPSKLYSELFNINFDSYKTFFEDYFVKFEPIGLSSSHYIYIKLNEDLLA